MGKVDSSCGRLNHGAQIVLAVGSVRAGAESKSVVEIVHRLEHSDNVFLAGDDSRKTEHRPRRIIRMNRHVDVVFVAHRHDCLEEVNQIFKKLFVVDVLVHCKEFLYACHAFRFPSRKNETVGILID